MAPAGIGLGKGAETGGWRFCQGMPDKVATSSDLAVARLAANQHGVVSTQQLEAVGVNREAISYRVRHGRLHRIHRGVYAVGHAGLSDEGRWMAAVLACGPEAVLSHHAAATLLRMLPPRSGPVDVTVPGDGGRAKRKGIRLHRSPSLTQPQTTRRAGTPVTTPSRTLIDLRRVVTPEDLSKAQRQAEFRGYRIDDAELGQPDPTRSELEHRFLRLCHTASLPSPEVNVPVGPYVVDFLWRHASLIVETDGYRSHRGRARFEHDHARQAQLIALGYEVLRFTWRQVVDDPDEVIAAARGRLTPSLPSLGPQPRGG